jgi:hypothetical protein
MPCLYKTLSKRPSHKGNFPFPNSGLTSAMMNSAYNLPDLTIIELLDKAEKVIVKKELRGLVS